MCSRVIACIAAFVCLSCSQYRKIELVRSGEVRMVMTIPEDDSDDERIVENVADDEDGGLSGELFLMNAIRDEETGEMVATDILSASSVTASFRNVAERAGYVTISFDVNVPAGMSDSRFCLKLYPELLIYEDTLVLEPLIVTGSKYREGQLRGYERYRRFLASIVTDTTDFIMVGQLDIFLQRYFPDTYKMKNDSSLVSDPLAETLFGTTQEEALRHYTRILRRQMNERRISRREEMFRRYVKDPILSEGVRLDTVLDMSKGNLVYSYSHSFKTIPGLKKVIVSMRGELFADGEVVADLPKPDSLSFYISTLSSLIDDTPKYKIVVLERRAHENTKVFLDFGVGSSQVDTNLGNNSYELTRIKDYIDAVVAQNEFILDSLLIVASCSPEGSWKFNDLLSSKRSDAVLQYVRNYVPEELRGSLRTSRIPENWESLREMVENDTIMTEMEKISFMKLVDDVDDPDKREKILKRHERYLYIKETLYPELRSVSFDFYLHRVGMVKDTIHTTELDTLYMSGLEAMRNLDYRTAIELLAPYEDYNAALAYVSLDRNYSALEILSSMDKAAPRVCYLTAVVLARLGLHSDALKYFQMAKMSDPSFQHRANLDPELSSILKLND